MMYPTEIAVATPIRRTFTYLAAEPLPVGTRVVVPFGRQRLVGVALGAASLPEGGAIKLKAVERCVDDMAVYSQKLIDLGRWLSEYYLHPLGEVLRTMLPAATTAAGQPSLVLTDAGLVARGGGNPGAGRILAQLLPGSRQRLAENRLRKKWADLAAAGDPDALFLTVDQLVTSGLMRREQGAVGRGRRERQARPTGAEAASSGELTQPQILTPAQAEAMDHLRTAGALAGRGVHLLHGVTGAGKTEIYLQLIAAVLASGSAAQALVMVPEISLTPQMTRIFAARFPGQVAVVHSGMSDPERWGELSRIRRGEAKVLIGPRSAVFGPFAQLELILVDEEHDASYKQGSGLPYNGRDVAVVRGRIEGAAVVLGSATPSLESFHNARQGRYTYVELKERVGGRPLPTIELISSEALRPAGRFGALIARPGTEPQALGDDGEDFPVDDRVIAALKANLERGEQAIVLIGRRGYAHYLYSLEGREPVSCPRCSISLTLHRRGTVLRCHYCDYRQTVSEVVAGRPHETFVAVGHGSQKAEVHLRNLLPGARVARLDSDATATAGYLDQTLAAFRQGELDILVGTQMLAKGHDFPKVTLIAILEIDQVLSLPDFRAGERAFQLVVQAAGRAGRGEWPGRVLVQTMCAENPVIKAAVGQDYTAFATKELAFRQGHGYPPHARLVAIELAAAAQAQVETVAADLEEWLRQQARVGPAWMAGLKILGPTPPPLEVLRGQHRRVLLVSGPRHDGPRGLARALLERFTRLPASVRLRVDVDPQSLL